jgi:hypothetical protein
MALEQTYYLQWEDGELVTSDIMTSLSDTLAGQILAITNNLTPCILSGGQVTFDSENSTATVTTGYYRIANQTINSMEIPGYFYAPDTNLSNLNSNDYIVARFSATSSSDFVTVITGTILNTQTPEVTDVILANFGASANYRSNDLQQLIQVLEKADIETINNATLNNHTILANQVYIVSYTANGTLLLPALSSFNSYSTISISNLTNSLILITDSSSNVLINLPPNSTINFKPFNSQWVLF